jgi:hypothetical protein
LEALLVDIKCDEDILEALLVDIKCENVIKTFRGTPSGYKM